MARFRAAHALLMVAAIGLLATYHFLDPERRTLDNDARAAAPGSFVRLEDGVTHYEVAGPDSGRVVLLAAAFSVPAYLSDSLFQRLGRDGFRAVRFDYYGRGWSDRLDTTYDLDLFGRQMTGLLDSLHVVGAVDVIGLSYGAAIVANFADRHPGRVRTLTYIDPVFNNRRPLPTRERTAANWDWYMVFGGGSEAMATGQLDDFLHPERHPDWVARYRVQQQFNGTREAWRRTRAAIADWPDQAEQLRRVGADARPVLVLWGRQDMGAPISESAALLAAMPGAVLVPVDSAGHLPHLEQPDVVVPVVEGFLRAAP